MQTVFLINQGSKAIQLKLDGWSLVKALSL
jgi:hypothetical protein